MILFHKPIDRLFQIFDRFLVAMLYRIYDAVFYMVLQYELTGVIDSGFNCRQLNQYLAAIPAVFDHSLDRFKMTDRLGKAIDYSLSVLVAVRVTVLLVMGMSVLYNSAVFQYMFMSILIHLIVPPRLFVVYDDPFLL